MWGRIAGQQGHHCQMTCSPQEASPPLLCKLIVICRCSGDKLFPGDSFMTSGSFSSAEKLFVLINARMDSWLLPKVTENLLFSLSSRQCRLIQAFPCSSVFGVWLFALDSGRQIVLGNTWLAQKARSGVNLQAFWRHKTSLSRKRNSPSRKHAQFPRSDFCRECRPCCVCFAGCEPEFWWPYRELQKLRRDGAQHRTFVCLPTRMAEDHLTETRRPLVLHFSQQQNREFLFFETKNFFC